MPTTGFERTLPVAFNGCTCSCHVMPGVYHVAPCCYPIPREPEVLLDPTPWLEVNKRTREATRHATPTRERTWSPRPLFAQEKSDYPWEALSEAQLYRYSVRRALAVVQQRGYNYHFPWPPPWGYYVDNPSLGWDSLRRMQAVVDTQKILHERFHIAGTYDQRDVALYDATRAFYEYTDPFGAKTYA